jgi:hypothetical protein
MLIELTSRQGRLSVITERKQLIMQSSYQVDRADCPLVKVKFLVDRMTGSSISGSQDAVVFFGTDLPDFIV